MTQPTVDWMNGLLEGYKQLSQDGTVVPKQPQLDIVGATLEDDPTNNVTRMTITAGSGGGQQTTPVSNGLNSNVATGSQGSIRLSGPTAAFSLGGFAAPPAAGAALIVVNTTTQPMTLVHEDLSSTAVNRIDTQSGAPVTLPPGRKGAASFVYDGTTERWVLQNIGLSYPTVLHAFDFGAEGDGSTDDSTALQAAATAAGTHASASTLHLDAATYRLSNSVSIPANVTLKFAPGAIVSIDSTKVLTILGRIDADPYQQIFEGSGSVTVGNSSGTAIHELWVGWWGADPTGNNDSLPAFTAALHAAAPIPTSGATGPHWSTVGQGPTYPNPFGSTQNRPKIRIPPGVYWQNGTLYVDRLCTTIEGGGPGSYLGANTVIVTPRGVRALVQLNVTGGGLRLRNILFSSGGASVNGVPGGTTGYANVAGQLFPKWLPGTAYSTGDVVVPNYHMRYSYALQCVTGGTSAGPAMPAVFGYTFTVLDSTASQSITADLMTGDQTLHTNAINITTTGNTTTDAATIAAQLATIYGATATVTSAGAVVTVHDSVRLMSLPGNWDTTKLEFNLLPSNDWRSHEPDLLGFIETNGTSYSGPYKQFRDWMPGAIFQTGDTIVTVPGNGFFYRNTGSQAATGETPPTFPVIIGHTVADGSGGVVWECVASSQITDGTAVWQPIVAHAVDLMGGYSQLENVFVDGYPGNGFNNNAELFANGFGNTLIACGHRN